MSAHLLHWAWPCVVETAALRRDARTMYGLALAVPAIGRRAISSSPEYRYWVHFFDEVYFRLDHKCVVHGRLTTDTFVVHADDKPAVAYANGVIVWKHYGQVHRDGGPAIEHFPTGRLFGIDAFVIELTLDLNMCDRRIQVYTGDQFWFQHNKLHRVDGPAIVHSALVHGIRSMRWYFDHKLHRDGGPAIEWSNGVKEWYKHGKRHCTDGPAIIYANGDTDWFQEQKLHRVGGPALVRNDRTLWYIDGELHRTDGPAVEYADGSYTWCLHGKPHRVDGPATKSQDGTLQWYIHGQLHRVGNPATECANGDRLWYEHDKFHRVGGPAVERANGDTEWWIRGKKHRVDGPAVERADGTKEWWIAGEQVAPFTQ